ADADDDHVRHHAGECTGVAPDVNTASHPQRAAAIVTFLPPPAKTVAGRRRGLCRSGSPCYPAAMAATLTIRGLRARPVDVPLKRPLQTSGGLVGSAPLVLIDV